MSQVILKIMRVKVADKLRSPKNVTSVIPQGSVLGTVLFFIYINNIENSVYCSCKAVAHDF